MWFRIATFALFLSCSVTTAAQTKVIDQNNIYSPTMIKHNGKLTMLYSGWANPLNCSNPNTFHDAIYRATCNSKTNCTTKGPVLRPQDHGLQAVADPHIIKHPSGFYIMYYTALRTDATQCANDPDTPNCDESTFYCPTADEHFIYYSTSWNTRTWSAPQALKAGFWQPTATVKYNSANNYTIYMYALSGFNGLIERFNLGSTGNVIWAQEDVDINGRGTGTSGGYFQAPQNQYQQYLNPDVANRGGNAWQMLLEYKITDAYSRIDAFNSTNGLDWTTTYTGVVQPVAPNRVVRSPTAHPDNWFDVYFGQTPTGYTPQEGGSVDNDIYHHNWN